MQIEHWLQNNTVIQYMHVGTSSREDLLKLAAKYPSMELACVTPDTLEEVRLNRHGD